MPSEKREKYDFSCTPIISNNFFGIEMQISTRNANDEIGAVDGRTIRRQSAENRTDRQSKRGETILLARFKNEPLAKPHTL